MKTHLGILAARLRSRILSASLRFWFAPRRNGSLVRLGTDYGGWWVPRLLVESGRGRVAYCGGAGEDISFDLQLWQRGWTVRVFDPTPRAAAYVRANAPESDRFSFVEEGWWERAEVIRFYSPKNAAHVSHSIVNLQRTDTFFEAAVNRLGSFVQQFDDSRIDLVKMDIEGAEYAVLNSIIEDGLRPEALLVEFDQPCSLRKTLMMVNALRRVGYEVVSIERWNWTFLLSHSEIATSD